MVEIVKLIPYQQACLCEKVVDHEEPTKSNPIILVESVLKEDNINCVKYRIIGHGRAMKEDHKQIFKIGDTCLARRETDNTTSVSVNGKDYYIVFLVDMLAICGE